jgi:hypothetical protein
LGLALIAIVLYTDPAGERTWKQLVQLGPWELLRLNVKPWFQTLMHIAATTLWILPVIRARMAIRAAFAVASAAIHLAISNWFYFDWVQTGGIDGGVLGFLAWTIPIIVGTLACDIVMDPGARTAASRLPVMAVLLMLAGWLLSCGSSLYDIPPGVDPLPSQEWAADPVIPAAERWQTHSLRGIEPPFVAPPGPSVREENYWMMSQRAATLSYHVFGAGFALAVYWLFHVACDLRHIQFGMFRTLGANALIGYALHGFIGAAVGAFMPKDAPAWYVTAGFIVYFSITYLFLRKLESDKIFVRL